MTFRLFFSGAEHPSWRKRLLENDVKRMAVNFTDLLPRLPKTKDWRLDDHFPDDVELALTWSPRGAWDEEPKAYHEFVDRYEAFVETERSRLTWVLSVDDAPEWGVPLWNGSDRAEQVVATHESVAFTSAHMESPSARNFMGLAKRVGLDIVGVGIGDADLMQGLRDVTTSSWISATRYGETVVWDGARMRRFAANRKDEVRSRYRAAIARSGVDPEQVLADDKESMVRLTLWSWQQLEASMVTRRIRRIASEPEDDGVVDLAARSAISLRERYEDAPVEPVANTDMTGGSLVPVTRDERQVLPVLQMTRKVVHGEGEEEDTETLLTGISSTTLRQCDTCSLAGNCPGFQPQHECAYDMPIEVRTKDQLNSFASAMLEMQAQRIAFLRMSEELNGGYADPNLSSELDRWTRIAKDIKEINDQRDFVNIQVQAKAGGGMLSRLFGEKVGEQARALPSGGLGPEETDHFVAQKLGIEEPIDAEVIEDR